MSQIEARAIHQIAWLEKHSWYFEFPEPYSSQRVRVAQQARRWAFPAAAQESGAGAGDSVPPIRPAITSI